jgi:hypothetical protein
MENEQMDLNPAWTEKRDRFKLDARGCEHCTDAFDFTKGKCAEHSLGDAVAAFGLVGIVRRLARGVRANARQRSDGKSPVLRTLADKLDEAANSADHSR